MVSLVSERSRFHLPSLGALAGPSRPPSIEEARRALGGAAVGKRTGERVEVDRGRGRSAEGLVVLRSATEVDVFLGDGVFARIRAPDGPRPLTRPSPALDAPAADLERFASLRVGDAVLARRERRGVVLEICRYGALVESDGVVLAVGFRNLAPDQT